MKLMVAVFDRAATLLNHSKEKQGDGIFFPAMLFSYWVQEKILC